MESMYVTPENSLQLEPSKGASDQTLLPFSHWLKVLEHSEHKQTGLINIISHPSLQLHKQSVLCRETKLTTFPNSTGEATLAPIKISSAYNPRIPESCVPI